ncbi:MAG: response regulator [bacterium]
MEKSAEVKELKKKILLLETQISHLQNDLRLTKEDYDISTKNYFEIFSKLEKQVEERTRELRESYEKNKILIETIPDGIAITTLDGRIIDANKAFQNMLGYSMEELKTMTQKQLTPDKWNTIELDAINYILKRGHWSFEKEYIKKDGTIVPISVTGWVIKDSEGNPNSLGAFVKDITSSRVADEEKKRLETQLRQSQKMEAIGTLAGGIAHDFNNILFPILGYTEMLLDDISDGDLTRCNLEQVLKAAKRAKDLVKQILTFSRQNEHEHKPLNIQVIIDEALKLLRASLPSTIDIIQNIDKHCGPVLADATQIHQVIMNMGTNAYHAMFEKGGVLEVSLVEVDLDSTNLEPDMDLEPGPYVKLTFADTGHGMDPEVMERIFDPYFTTKSLSKGTGMGLSVVHGIVTSHKGHISVSSKADEGATFHIYLPRIRTLAAEQEMNTSPSIPKGNESILLIDDEESILQMLQQMLERLGYRITALTSSLEALEAFRTQQDKFDLIITDQTMPNMTGDKLAEEIIKIRPDLPIILFSGFSEIISEQKAKSIGIKEFIMKPLVKSEIAHTIRKVLSEKIE